MNWLYSPNWRRSISAWMGMCPDSFLLFLPDRHRTGGRSYASREPKTQTLGCKSACPMASCCRSPPHTTPVFNFIKLTTFVTLCDTGRIQRMLPLEWMWALVLALLGSAARMPWSKSCLLYRDMSGFQRSAGGILEQHSLIACQSFT